MCKYLRYVGRCARVEEHSESLGSFFFRPRLVTRVLSRFLPHLTRMCFFLLGTRQDYVRDKKYEGVTVCTRSAAEKSKPESSERATVRRAHGREKQFKELLHVFGAYVARVRFFGRLATLSSRRLEM